MRNNMFNVYVQRHQVLILKKDKFTRLYSYNYFIDVGLLAWNIAQGNAEGNS